jgi:hypothetical protein
MCYYICVCHISEHVSPEDIWRLLGFVSRCSTEKNAFSYSSYGWRYLITDSAKEIDFDEEGNQFKAQVQVDELSSHSSCVPTGHHEFP